MKRVGANEYEAKMDLDQTVDVAGPSTRRAAWEAPPATVEELSDSEWFFLLTYIISFI